MKHTESSAQETCQAFNAVKESAQLKKKNCRGLCLHTLILRQILGSIIAQLVASTLNTLIGDSKVRHASANAAECHADDAVIARAKESLLVTLFIISLDVQCGCRHFIHVKV